MLNSILFAICFVFLVTKNGRRLLHLISRSIILNTPFPIRRFINRESYRLPLSIVRQLLKVTTSPIGDETSWILEINKQNSWKGKWIASQLKNIQNAEDTASDQDLIILYFHGGGFVQGHATMYMEAFQFIINQLQQIYKLQARILSVEYSLSPEHVWPKASEECIQAYRYLIHDLSVSPCRVIIAGDSAGGNLAATLLLRLKKERQKRKEELMNDMFKRAPLPLPGGAALFSPWIDLSGFSLVDNKKDIIGNHQLEMFASCYLPSSSVNNKDPLISPIYGNFDDIDCPLFIAYGSEELLRPSIEEWISNKLKRDNVTVIQGQEATHIWLMSRLAAKTTKSFERDNRQFIQWLSTIYSC